jgi:hypothetical protein
VFNYSNTPSILRIEHPVPTKDLSSRGDFNTASKGEHNFIAPEKLFLQEYFCVHPDGTAGFFIKICGDFLLMTAFTQSSESLKSKTK